MTEKLLLWIAWIVPLLSLLFLKKDVLKRYMPVAVFTALLVTIVFELAHALRWWELTVKIVPWGYITNVSFAYGLFVAGTIWIFYFTFRNFWLYVAVNASIDALQAFVFDDLFEGRIYRLVRINDFQVFLLMFGIAFVIYGYHRWQQGVFAKVEHPPRSPVVGFRNPFRRKERA